MTKTSLKKELESFKSQMQEVNKSIEDLECQFHVEQIKIHSLRASFANMVKLINHELVQSLDNTNNLIEKLARK